MEPALPWPATLPELWRSLSSSPGSRARAHVRSEAWLLLNTALCHYLRRHCAKMGPVPPAVLEDIASAKALDLFVKSELNQWSLAGRTAPELCGYLSAVARNGLVEYLREARRHVPLADSAGGSSDGSAEEARVTRASAEQGPDRVLERREFALALRDCLEQLESRPRRMWLVGVFSATRACRRRERSGSSGTPMNRQQPMPVPAGSDPHTSEAVCIDLLHGLLPDSERDAILEHMKACSVCEETLRRLAGERERLMASE